MWRIDLGAVALDLGAKKRDRVQGEASKLGPSGREQATTVAHDEIEVQDDNVPNVSGHELPNLWLSVTASHRVSTRLPAAQITDKTRKMFMAVRE